MPLRKQSEPSSARWILLMRAFISVKFFFTALELGRGDVAPDISVSWKQFLALLKSFALIDQYSNGYLSSIKVQLFHFSLAVFARALIEDQ
jgi:hypothetical protein